MEKLLAEPCPKNQITQKTIMCRWVPIVKAKWEDMLATATDVNRWYTTKTCRNPDDRLYCHLLRGLVARLEKTSGELRAELYKRLYEECSEARGMCCEGHITRLCNVLVGFDDAFAPPVPFGEILQNKMSAIASMDIETEEKIQQATAFFNEYAVPDADRAAWLEAF